MADLPVAAISGKDEDDATALENKSKIKKVVDTLRSMVDFLESSEFHLCSAADIKMKVSMQKVQDICRAPAGALQISN